MTRSPLVRITGKDKGLATPNQQASSTLGRVGDYTILNPYGFFCDLPNGAYAKVIDEESNTAIPVTQKRPIDVEQGEPVFYHPVTNTRIIERNDGSLDIETGEGGTAPVNIKCTQANVTASESVNIDSPITNLGTGGNKIARLGDEVTVSGVKGTITAAGVNTSI